MATGASGGSFKISHAPLASSTVRPEPDASDEAELPSHYNDPLLLAIARNARTLFVCWIVDWAAAFGSAVPADRKAHVKLKCGNSEKTHAVEPLSGNCAIGHLVPGETYLVELGYYAPVDEWNVVVAGHEVMMPMEAPVADGDAPMDVATVPFHLSFQRLLDLFDKRNRRDVVRDLAEWEVQALQDSNGESNENLLRELDLSLDDLRAAAALRETLAKIRTRPQRAERFGSPVGSSWTNAAQ